MRNLVTQTRHFGSNIHIFHQLLNGLGAHLGVELVTELFHRFVVLLVRQQLPFLKGCHAGVGHYERFEIEDAFDVTQGHIEQQADTRWQ